MLDAGPTQNRGRDLSAGAPLLVKLNIQLICVAKLRLGNKSLLVVIQVQVLLEVPEQRVPAVHPCDLLVKAPPRARPFNWPAQVKPRLAVCAARPIRAIRVVFEREFRILRNSSVSGV